MSALFPSASGRAAALPPPPHRSPAAPSRAPHALLLSKSSLLQGAARRRPGMSNVAMGSARRLAAAGVSRRRGAAAAAAAPADQGASLTNLEPSEKVLHILQAADAVCFDVDSTVCTDEGIDELAGFLGKGEEVAAWTRKAMGGGVPFQDALDARLSIMNPCRQNVSDFTSQHPPSLSPGIKELVDALHAKGKAVYLVSGGFTQMIEPVADLLGVKRERVFANTILFEHNSGDYAGFDKAAFTSRAGGKAAAIKHLKAENGYSTVIMMGDGATDLEARQPGGAQLFIGYGGVAFREGVAAEADWYLFSFDPLLEALKGM